MSSPLATSLPYGIRDCKLTPYNDVGGTVLGATSVDLPYMQTFSFSETEEFTELRGDDKIITTRGQGAQVEWELESGGISLKAWAIFSGGSVIETGTTPNRKVTMRKMASANRPFFRVQGQAISDSGGDLHTIVYRCRCNDTIEGEFADGEFFATSVSGLGLPLLNEDFDLLYDFIQNETQTAIPTTPLANPPQPPVGVTVASITATGATVDWADVPGATSYVVQRSVSPFSTWVSAGANPTPSLLAITGLTTATTYQVRVASIIGGIQSDWSTPVQFTTA